DEKRAATEGDKLAELRRGRRLDSALYYQDLWTTCTLKWFNTTWSPYFVERVTAPHLVYPDVGGQSANLPRPGEREENRRIVRGLSQWFGELVFGSQALPPPGRRP